MAKAKHTPGPWELVNVFPCAKREHCRWIINPDVATGKSKANAARIVACVNACEGINPEAVPGLLKACISGAAALLQVAPKEHPALDTYKEMRSAIAKAQLDKQNP